MAYLFLAWLTEGARLFAQLPRAAVQLPPFPLWLLLGYYVIVVGGWLSTRWSHGATTAMEPSEDHQLIEGHIERAASGSGEIPADVFVDLLFERIATRTGTTLTLEIDVTDDQLVITPDRDSADVVVQGNEVLIGGHRLVLQLARRPK